MPLPRLSLWVGSLVSLALGCMPLQDPPAAGNGDPITSGLPDPSSRATVPILGGSLAVYPPAHLAVATDPDNARVFVVRIASELDGGSRVTGSIKLEPGDEPGRVAIDAKGRAHVVLRASGELLSFWVTSPALHVRRHVCAEPRGVTTDDATGQVIVACATGHVVTLEGTGEGGPVSSFEVEPDLRDVALAHGELFVSKFRSAELLHLSRDGEVIGRTTPQGEVTFRPDGTQITFTPGVAWRMTTDGAGDIVVVHQMGQITPIELADPPDPSPAKPDQPEPSPYGGDPLIPCSSILHTAVSRGDGTSLRTTAFDLTLPVDVAVKGDGTVAIAAAGTRRVAFGLLPGPSSAPGCSAPAGLDVDVGEPISVAFLDNLEVMQMRNPSRLVTPFGTVMLSQKKILDPGHALFHHAAAGGGSPACASCHPEATEDGRTWSFLPIGPRRTQNVSGGIRDTAPFHWDGDLPDLRHLVSEVFVRRMGGGTPSTGDVDAMMAWLQQTRPLHPDESIDPEAIARGKALFEDGGVGCATCHQGERFTSNRAEDVGTGGRFQVPSLRQVGLRANLMHDGCAPTLADRFGACGGGDLHGQTSQLTGGERDDLIAYLRSL